MRLHDFYTSVNKQWLKRHKIPSDDSSYSVFDQVEEKIKNQMIDIIRSERKRDTPLGHFIESFYTGRDQDIDILKGFVHHVQSHKSLGTQIGLLNLYELESPVKVSVSYDQRNTNRCIVYLSPPSLGIMKADYTQDVAIQKAYKEYLSKLGTLLDVDHFAKSIFALEKSLSSSYPDPEEADRTELSYNPMTYSQLKETYPAIQFNEIFEVLQISTHHFQNLVVVTNQLYFKQLNSMLKQHGKQYCDTWIQYLVYSSFMEMLPNPYKSLHFDFYGSFISGQKKQYSTDHQAYLVCDDFVQDTLGKRYIEHNVDRFKKIQAGANEIYSKVHAAAKKRIHKLTWLSEDSRQIAEYKLQRMNAKIAFPQIWLDEFSGVAIDPSCFMMNIFALSKKQVLYEISKLDGLLPTDKKLWNNSCYEVNAYYYAELNELCVPTGFLQPPFFAPDQHFIINLAGLGNVIAHEISHGFDEEGRKFDEYGNNFPWWTAQDIQLYTSRTRSLIQEFDKQHVDGIQINGKLTLGENLADFGAVAICLDVLKDYWVVNNTAAQQQKKDLREFFTAYTKSWAFKNTAAARLQASKSDSHAPPILRVNVVLRHFKEFYEAFDFTSDDEGWIPPEQRIDVWGI